MYLLFLTVESPFLTVTKVPAPVFSGHSSKYTLFVNIHPFTKSNEIVVVYWYAAHWLKRNYLWLWWEEMVGGEYRCEIPVHLIVPFLMSRALQSQLRDEWLLLLVSSFQIIKRYNKRNYKGSRLDIHTDVIK